jgi:hypothetical protein
VLPNLEQELQVELNQEEVVLEVPQAKILKRASKRNSRFAKRIMTIKMSPKMLKERLRD